MSFDVFIERNGQIVRFEEPHSLTGGTYQRGGSQEAWLNVTYNYSRFYYEALNADFGLRWLNCRSVALTTGHLRAAIRTLGAERTGNYWEATPGNAGAALADLLALVRLAKQDSEEPDAAVDLNVKWDVS